MMPKRIRSFIISVFALISLISSCTPPAHMIKKGWMFHDDKSGTKRERIVRTAKRFIGARYRYGGKDPFGFDCSGFVLYVYNKNGINIPRGSKSQYYSGKRVRIKEAKPGDLVFFSINSKKISHVGIYLGNFRFIHSPREGRKVSCASIKNTYWRKRYAGAATYFF